MKQRGITALLYRICINDYVNNVLNKNNPSLGVSKVNGKKKLKH